METTGRLRASLEWTKICTKQLTAHWILIQWWWCHLYIIQINHILPPAAFLRRSKAICLRWEARVKMSYSSLTARIVLQQMLSHSSRISVPSKMRIYLTAGLWAFGIEILKFNNEKGWTEKWVYYRKYNYISSIRAIMIHILQILRLHEFYLCKRYKMTALCVLVPLDGTETI